MPLTKAQCPNCGGALEVDSSKDAAICPFCSTPYIVEKAISNYNIKSAVVHAEQIVMQNGLSLDEKIQKAQDLLDLGEYFEAYYAAKDVLNDYPKHHDARIIQFLALTEKSTRKDCNRVLIAEMKNIIDVLQQIQAPETPQMTSIYNKYLNEYTDQLNEVKRNCSLKLNIFSYTSTVLIILSILFVIFTVDSKAFILFTAGAAIGGLALKIEYYRRKRIKAQAEEQYKKLNDEFVCF